MKWQNKVKSTAKKVHDFIDQGRYNVYDASLKTDLVNKGKQLANMSTSRKQFGNGTSIGKFRTSHHKSGKFVTMKAMQDAKTARRSGNKTSRILKDISTEAISRGKDALSGIGSAVDVLGDVLVKSTLDDKSWGNFKGAGLVEVGAAVVNKIFKTNWLKAKPVWD